MGSSSWLVTQAQWRPVRAGKSVYSPGRGWVSGLSVLHFGPASWLQHHGRRNGADALDRIFRRGRYRDDALPDLIVMDLNIPLVTGHEVLNVIRSNSSTRHIPVIVWSGSVNPSDSARLTMLGHAPTLLKPWISKIPNPPCLYRRGCS